TKRPMSMAEIIRWDDDEESNFQEQVWEWILHKQFASLEAAATEMRKSKTRLKSGKWKLQSFYDALKLYAGTSRDWQAEYPRSITPVMARAGFYLKISDSLGKFKPLSWLFIPTIRRELRHARHILRDAKDFPNLDPEYYTTMLGIERELNAPEAELRAL